MTDTHHTAFRSLRRQNAGGSFLLILLVSACSAGSSSLSRGDAMDREVFIQTYVDLRVAALSTETQQLSDEDRAEVLTRGGVTADDLVNFAEVHGRDLDFMRNVWNDVELRMEALESDTETR